MKHPGHENDLPVGTAGVREALPTWLEAPGFIDEVNRKLRDRRWKRLDLARVVGCKASEVTRALSPPKNGGRLPRRLSRLREEISRKLGLESPETPRPAGPVDLETAKIIVGSEPAAIPITVSPSSLLRDSAFESLLKTASRLEPPTSDDHVYVVGGLTTELRALAVALAKKRWGIRRLVPEGVQARQINDELIDIGLISRYEAWRVREAAVQLSGVFIPGFAAYIVLNNEGVRLSEPEPLEAFHTGLRQLCESAGRPLLKTYANASSARGFSEYDTELNVAELEAHEKRGHIRCVTPGPPDVWSDGTLYKRRLALSLGRHRGDEREDLEGLLKIISGVHDDVLARFASTNETTGAQRRLHIYAWSSLATFARKGTPSPDDTFGLPYPRDDRLKMLDDATGKLRSKGDQYQVCFVPRPGALPRPELSDSNLHENTPGRFAWELITDAEDSPTRLFLHSFKGEGRLGIIFDSQAMIEWKTSFDRTWRRRYSTAKSALGRVDELRTLARDTQAPSYAQPTRQSAAGPSKIWRIGL